MKSKEGGGLREMDCKRGQKKTYMEEEAKTEGGR